MVLNEDIDLTPLSFVIATEHLLVHWQLLLTMFTSMTLIYQLKIHTLQHHLTSITCILSSLNILSLRSPPKVLVSISIQKMSSLSSIT